MMRHSNDQTMDPEEKQFLSLMILPAILSQHQAAIYLGLKWHNIPRLVEAGILTPLGHPKPNSLKFFALADLETLRSDPKKLSRSIDSIQGGWKRKNHRRAGQPSFRKQINPGDDGDSSDENGSGEEAGVAA
jgi:hypothetical protein